MRSDSPPQTACVAGIPRYRLPDGYSPVDSQKGFIQQNRGLSEDGRFYLLFAERRVIDTC